MIERIIALDDEPARLHVRNELLVVQRGEGESTVPLPEVAVVVISNPCVSLTHAVLSGLAQNGGVLITCNQKRVPAAMLLPLEGHFAQGERFVRQARASLPTNKRLWQSVVRAKISAQARLLVELTGGDAGLPRLVQEVRSGDPANVEGEAARRYWPRLFGSESWRRNRDAEDENALLNYGYAVLRAIVARAVCAAGLHPSLGIHHHNRYDAFRLADDLMEPLRPLVDRAVVTYCRVRDEPPIVDRAAKLVLLSTLTARFEVKGLAARNRTETRSLFDIAARTAGSLAAVYDGERTDLLLPEV